MKRKENIDPGKAVAVSAGVMAAPTVNMAIVAKPLMRSSDKVPAISADKIIKGMKTTPGSYHVREGKVFAMVPEVNKKLFKFFGASEGDIERARRQALGGLGIQDIPKTNKPIIMTPKGTNLKKLRSFDAAALAHEFGHLQHRQRSGALLKAGRSLNRLAANTTPLAALAVPFIQDDKKALITAGAVSTPGTLLVAEEAGASIRGLKGLKGLTRSRLTHAKNLLGALSTYGTIAAMPWLALLGRKLIKDKKKSAKK